MFGGETGGTLKGQLQLPSGMAGCGRLASLHLIGRLTVACGDSDLIRMYVICSIPFTNIATGVHFNTVRCNGTRTVVTSRRYISTRERKASRPHDRRGSALPTVFAASAIIE